ncbi:SDR family oxidoreductase [Candidatus Pacearchaeota archaeon]|nr:SDR family oxidoreductase [Candidatus Pacearchaeota archaeon]
MKFKNKVALVTGASRGIGRATALRLAQDGCDVAVNYIKDEKSAQSAVNEITKLGRKAIAIKADVSDETQVKQMIDKTIKAFGKIDILVNNAGIVWDIPLFEKTMDQFERTIDVNFKGVFLCSKYVALEMKKAKSGIIINISSTNAINTLSPDSIDYDATKAAVISMTKNFATELAPNIRVNCIAPGWVETDINNKLSEEYKKEEAEQILLKRFGKPEEIASVVAFLASEDASFITGSIIVVDGGYP